jgi:hypothetical protein
LVDLAAMQASTLTYRTGDTTTTIGARVVSENYFEVLGLHALYGRTFGSRDDTNTIKDPNAVVISYGFCKRLGGEIRPSLAAAVSQRVAVLDCRSTSGRRVFDDWAAGVARASMSSLVLGSIVVSKLGTLLNSIWSGEPAVG